MKFTNTILFASAVTAAPATMTAPTRRVSQELETVTTTTTAATMSEMTSATMMTDTESLDMTKLNLGADDADFEEYMQFLEDLPEKEWEAIFDSLTGAMEERLGLDIDTLEKLSDDEFDSLLKSM